MTEDLGDVIAYFRSKLSRMDEVTFEKITQTIKDGPFSALSDQQKADIRAILESSFNITRARVTP